jgi:hypothetical protein
VAAGCCVSGAEIHEIFLLQQGVQTFRENVRMADLRPTLVYFSVAFVAIVAGVVLRFAPLDLPYIVVRYGGSFLWAFMLYFLFAALLANRRPWTLALLAGVFESLVEFSRLYHTPGFDAFRLTLAGALLLGRVFNVWHLLVYWAAVGLAALLDGVVIRRGSESQRRIGRTLSGASR